MRYLMLIVAGLLFVGAERHVEAGTSFLSTLRSTVGARDSQARHFRITAIVSNKAKNQDFTEAELLALLGFARDLPAATLGSGNVGLFKLLQFKFLAQETALLMWRRSARLRTKAIAAAIDEYSRSFAKLQNELRVHGYVPVAVARVEPPVEPGKPYFNSMAATGIDNPFLRRKYQLQRQAADDRQSQNNIQEILALARDAYGPLLKEFYSTARGFGIKAP